MPDPAEVGTRLANRYRLEECLERRDGTSSWRAVDEKLSRPVGLHTVPVDHDLAEQVVAAARAAATVDDGRFLRVLDASRRDGLVYVVYEWVPDARPLRQLLADGPLDPSEAHALITEVAEAIAAAHRAGVAHLRLDPDTVLRTDAGQVKIAGLGTLAALHRLSAGDPALADTQALGRLLYAALTARWPDGPAYGLPAAQHEHGRLCTPRQVRAGVPQSLDDIVDRVLEPAPRRGAPLRSPGELHAALAELPRPRSASGPYAGAYRGPYAGGYAGPYSASYSGASGADPGSLNATRPVPALPPARPAAGGPSRATRIGQVAVGGVLAVGLILLGWQMVGPGQRGGTPGGSPTSGVSGPPRPLSLASVEDFDPPPGNGEERSAQVPLAYDGDPDTAWMTLWYRSPEFGRLKPGVGLVVDLGQTSPVREVRLQLVGQGTSLQIRAADPETSSPPMTPDDYRVVAEKAGLDTAETIQLESPIRTRYLLLWLTRLPAEGNDRYRGGIAEVEVRG